MWSSAHLEAATPRRGSAGKENTFNNYCSLYDRLEGVYLVRVPKEKRQCQLGMVGSHFSQRPTQRTSLDMCAEFYCISALSAYRLPGIFSWKGTVINRSLLADKPSSCSLGKGANCLRGASSAPEVDPVAACMTLRSFKLTGSCYTATGLQPVV